jgi:hypothetical protein
VLSDKVQHVPKYHHHTNLSSVEIEPLNESGTAFLLISLSVLKMLFMIEVIVYLGVITGKFLEHRTTFKLLHRPFLSSKWQM